MTEPNVKEFLVDEPDTHITHLLRQGSESRQRSAEEIRAILGSTSETVEVKILTELQLLSQTIGL